MENCIVTGEAIRPDNDSRAHVIPSALGGRLKPYGLVCDDGNGRLNDVVDIPLIKAFQPIMTLLGGSRDRGENPRIRMRDQAGKFYLVAFNQPLALAEPEYLIQSDDPIDWTTVKITIAARTKKEMRTLLGRVKKEYPDFDINEAMQQAALQEGRPIGMVGIQLQVGPAVVFPAAYVAASLFAAYNDVPAHPDFKEYVSEVDPTMVPVLLPPGTFYWYPPVDVICTRNTEVSHIIVLVADVARSQAFVYVEYFNIACIGTIIPYHGVDSKMFTYGVDIVAGREVDVLVDEVALRSLSWTATHTLSEEALYLETQARFHRVLGIAQRRAQAAAFDDMLKETLGPPDGRVLTEEDFAQLRAKIVEFVFRRLTPLQE